MPPVDPPSSWRAAHFSITTVAKLQDMDTHSNASTPTTTQIQHTHTRGYSSSFIMATLPTLLKTSSEEQPHTSLHLLPFHVAYSGPAKISAYFPIQAIPPVDDSDDNVESKPLYRSYFRGRMLVGAEISLPEGYSGQVWKSNAPSMSNSSINNNNRASTSRSISKEEMVDYSTSVNYSASSPRRSPRKHASASINASSSSSSITMGSKTTAAADAKPAKGKKKAPPPKRKRFAMSPDHSPVKEDDKEDLTDLSQFEKVLDERQEAVGKAKNWDKFQDALGDFEQALDDAEEALFKRMMEHQAVRKTEKGNKSTTKEPPKKRAKRGAEAKKESEAISEETADKDMKVDEANDAKVTVLQAEATTTTLQTAGETITSTTVKLERATTPPPSSVIPPSTPMSASAVLPIHIISPRTPRTPGGRLFSSSDNHVEESQIDNEQEGPIHQRIIQPVGKFDKIMIWNPDMELDRGDDCYVKALSEWTRLADLVSCSHRLSTWIMLSGAKHTASMSYSVWNDLADFVSFIDCRFILRFILDYPLVFSGQHIQHIVLVGIHGRGI